MLKRLFSMLVVVAMLLPMMTGSVLAEDITAGDLLSQEANLAEQIASEAVANFEAVAENVSAAEIIQEAAEETADEPVVEAAVVNVAPMMATAMAGEVISWSFDITGAAEASFVVKNQGTIVAQGSLAADATSVEWKADVAGEYTVAITASNENNSATATSEGNAILVMEEVVEEDTQEETEEQTEVPAGETEEESAGEEELIFLETEDLLGGIALFCKPVDTTAPTKVTISAPKTEIAVGESLQLTAVLTPITASTTLTWTSSSTSIASVDGYGMVRGVKAGTVTITVKTANSKKATICIKVYDPYKPTKVKFVPSSITLEEGQSVDLKQYLTATPAQAVPPNTAYTWSVTAGSKYGTVDQNGIATGLKAGSYFTVKAKYMPTCVYDTIKITVVPAAVKPVPTSLRIEAGTTARPVPLDINSWLQLYPVITPADAVTTYTWSTSAASIAVVDQNGLVTPKSVGTTLISVRTHNGLTASIAVRVYDSCAATCLSFTTADLTWELTGGQYDLNQLVRVTPVNANVNFSWSIVSGGNYVSVNANGVMTPLATGSATVRVTDTRSGLSATIRVHIIDSTAPTSVRIDAGTSERPVRVSLKSTLSLRAILTPANAVTTLTWTSSNTSVATVSAAGWVTPKAVGTTTITVRTANGLSDSLIVEVYDDTTVIDMWFTQAEVTHDISDGNLELWQLLRINPSVVETTLTWSIISGTNVGSISYWGSLTPNRTGSAVVQVHSSNGNKYASIKVNITDRCTAMSIKIDAGPITERPYPLDLDTQILQLGVIITPPTAVTTWTWTSSNTAVATIDQNGGVTPRGVGETTITVRTANGLTDSMVVRVYSSGAVTSLNFSLSTITAELHGGPVDLYAYLTVQPPTAVSTFSWAITSGTAVAAVGANTGIMTPKAVGTATVRVTALNGNKTATAQIKIIDSYEVKSVEIDVGINERPMIMYVGETRQLTATLNPTDAITTLSWTSSVASVAAVDQTGLVTAKKVGTTTITVRTANGKTATLPVQVIDPTVVTSISFSLSTITAELHGGPVDLNAYLDVQPPTAVTTFSWAIISGTTVAAVNASTGIMTPKKVGTATVRVTALNGSKSATALIKIVDSYEVSSVEIDVGINERPMIMHVGETRQLTATLNPVNAITTLTWTSSVASVAAVDQTGLVTAKKVGTTTITVRTANGKTATLPVQVIDPNVVTSICLSATSITVELHGGPVDLNQYVSVLPVTANPTLVWSVSSGTSYASVGNSTGILTPKAVGTSTVRVSASGTTKSATMIVKVVDSYAPISVMIDAGTNERPVVVNLQDTLQLTAILTPVNAITTLTWSSSSTSVATVDQNGLVIPKKVGTATITVRTANGKTATCAIKVVDPNVVTSLKFSVSEITVELMDGPVDVSQYLTHSPATANPSITWSVTAGSAYASVDQNGIVTPKAVGTATVRALATNGSKSDTIRVKVINSYAATSVKIDRTGLSNPAQLSLQSTLQLRAIVTPANAVTTLTWSVISGTNVLSVDQNGLVTPKKAGTATVKVMTDNGKYDTIIIKVYDPSVVTCLRFTECMITMEVGQTLDLNGYLVIEPAGATSPLVWKNLLLTNYYASVNSQGIVTAHRVGIAKVQVTATSGCKTACVYIKVIKTCEVAVSSVSINATGPVEMYVGDTVQLSATVLPTNATNKTITWSSNLSGIASVNGNGLVTGVAPGTATITATASNGRKATITVIVKERVVEVSSITINADRQFDMNQGSAITLTATVLPANATNKTVTWSSSNGAVASIDQNGRLTANAGGTVTITATSANGLTDSVQVTVIPSVVSVLINGAPATMVEGDLVQLTATVTPVGAPTTFTWTSSNTAVLKVDANGLVTAVAPGTASITVRTANGMTDTVTITVEAAIVVVTSVSINIGGDFDLNEGDSVILTATVTPSNATDKSLTWTTSDASVATVDQNGKVTGISGGAAVITVTTSNGIQDSVVVNVIPAVQSLTLEGPITMMEGEQASFTATVTPANAPTTLTWTTSNAAVLTVDENGLATAVAAGVATVTVRSANGLTASLTVTVEACVVVIEVTSLTITGASDPVEMRVGDLLQLGVTIEPVDATEVALTWTSENAGIASVDANGLVTAISPGTTVVTITNENGVSASITVIVLPEVVNVTINTGIYGDPVELWVGDIVQFGVEVDPADAQTEITWESFEADIASVDNTGLVMALSVGETFISATAGNGVSDSVMVIVRARPVSITIDTNGHGDPVYMDVGEVVEFEAIIEPENATTTLTWESSDPSIATVVDGVVTALKPGQTLVTVTTDNGLSASVTVIVREYQVLEFYFTQTSLSRNLLDGSVDLRQYLVINPPEAVTTVTWSIVEGSENATIDQNGVLTPIQKGAVVVQAHSSNGDLTTDPLAVEFIHYIID